MSLTPQEPLIYDAPGPHTATVIFVHGLGDTGEAWKATVEDWRTNDALNGVKFVLPNAPMRPMSWRKGEKVTGWFDLCDAGDSIEECLKDEDVQGIMESSTYIESLIQNEIAAGIDSSRLIVGGFSQGGAVSVLAALTSKQKLGGIISLSAWVPRSDHLNELIPKDSQNQNTPIFMGQGIDDRTVKPALGKRSFNLLKKLGYDVTWEVYPDMGHAACLDELEDVQAFIEDQLTSPSA